MIAPETIAEGITLHPGDCLDVLKAMADASVDSCVTDPPYHLTSIVKRFGAPDAAPAKEGKTGAYARASRGFMGKQWDGGDIAFRTELWAEVLRVLKPGGHLLAFSGTRTYHRMTCAIEDAGFEIRDQIGWAYGSGFPKSHDVSKGIDKAAGAERQIIGPNKFAHLNGKANVNVYGAAARANESAPVTDFAAQWQGWGTALKPAWEPIVLARKPLIGTVAQNVLAHGTGAINIDACRIEATDPQLAEKYASVQNAGPRDNSIYGTDARDRAGSAPHVNGRWPANIVHDGSEEVVGAFPESESTASYRGEHADMRGDNYNRSDGKRLEGSNSIRGHNDSGSAARFFYQVKQDDPCHSIRFANDAESRFGVQSEHVVSALSHAVEASMPQSELHGLSYRAPNMTVSERELKIVCASVTEAIQNLGRRSWLGLEQESTTVRLGPVICVAAKKPTGIMTITLSLWKSVRCVEAVTFNIIETSAEVGASVSGKRLFYTAKADQDDRLGSKHPTVKPLDLMQWLVRLVTPPGGTVLDPFSGTGTTGEAAFREGFRAVLIEREPEYQNDIRRRMSLVLGGPDERRRESIKASGKTEDAGPLFSGL
jgi:DNA modification methylase